MCAMAETIHFYEAAENGQLLAGMQLGSLSQTSAAPTPDVSPAAKSRELYRCAGLYLDIRRDEQGVAHAADRWLAGLSLLHRYRHGVSCGVPAGIFLPPHCAARSLAG